jgi:hypothetical protein
MIALAFFTSTVGRALAAVGVILVLMGGPYLVGRWQGSAACEARWQEAARVEAARQRTANELAKEAERLRIERMQQEIAERDELIQELANEADLDPDAAACGLSGSGSLRINRVR